MTCPSCEYNKERAARWRREAYRLGGTPLPEPEGGTMNSDIIKLALAAGISESHAQGMQGFLERFAHLVYESVFRDAHLAASRTILDAAILEEREACAKACDAIAQEMEDQGEGPTGYISWVEDCAKAIRKRGNP